MKAIVITGACILLAAFFSLIGLAIFKISTSGPLDNVDAVSFQISLLEIIITTIALGGGVLAFLVGKK